MIGRLSTYAALALALQLSWAGSGEAQSLSLSGDPQALVISTAVAGLAPDPAEDQGTTYSVSVLTVTNVVAQLDAALPSGVALWVRLEPPAGATGQGWVQLSTTPQVVVGSVLTGTYSGLGVEYRLTATVEAGVVALNSRLVTFTLKSVL